MVNEYKKFIFHEQEYLIFTLCQRLSTGRTFDVLRESSKKRSCLR